MATVGDLEQRTGGMALGGKDGHEAGSGPPAARACNGSPTAAPPMVAGATAAMQSLRELIVWPLAYRDDAAALGVRWPRGLLLHGPPGCGKSLMVAAAVAEAGASLHVVTASDVAGAYVGESERALRRVFGAARADAAAGRPAVVLLDEADALCPRRGSGSMHEARVVAQLLTLLDGADTKEGAGAARDGDAAADGLRHARSSTDCPDLQRIGGGGGGSSSYGGAHVVVIATTNRPNALDPALRRPGRLDREVAIGMPDASERAQILRLHTRGLTLSDDVSLVGLAAACHGYSGADLAALAREAATHALMAAAAPLLAGGEWAGIAGAGAVSPGQTRIGTVTSSDFTAAMRRVGPSIVRGAAVEVVPTSWDDVGGLHDVKRRLRQAVEWPLRHAHAFARLGLSAPRGVLLWGPPGCCKTTLARAAATASGATLLPLSCAQLFSMYVGDGEDALRGAFRRARMAAPAIIFLDEVDALAASRSDAGGGGGSSSLRLLSSLLTEMDGMELATGVLVLAATNRPAAVDAALMRPGRLDVQLYVPPPDAAGRADVLRVHTKGMPLAQDVDLNALAVDTEGFTGAELAGLCREAAIAALREDLVAAAEVANRHFQAARAAMRAALTSQVLAQYEKWQRDRQGRRAVHNEAGDAGSTA